MTGPVYFANPKSHAGKCDAQKKTPAPAGLVQRSQTQWKSDQSGKLNGTGKKPVVHALFGHELLIAATLVILP